MFGLLYEPQSSVAPAPDRGVVFCAPYGEEAGISLKVCVNFARHLARCGYRVLRFDYRGDGDSEGRFEEASLVSRMTDIRDAVALLRQCGSSRVALFGLRVGASLAAMVAAANPSVEALVLWEPVVKLSDYINNLLRARVMAENALAGRVVLSRKNLHDELEGGGTVDALGYPLTPSAFREFSRWDVLESLGGGAHGPVLIASIALRTRPRKDLEAMVEAYRRHGRRAELVQVKERPFWIDLNNPWRELASWQGHGGVFRLSSRWLEAVGYESGS
jgi:pimeloyl-ACP methyl ester carboxylesterase